MEIPFELIWLVLLAAYYVLSAMRRGQRKKKQQTQGQPRVTEAGEAKGPTPFEEFMRQMEEAMREASGEPRPTGDREPVDPVRTEAVAPAPVSVPSPPPPRPVSEFRDVGSFSAETSFESSRTSAHERHGFGLDQPFSEERFEQLARGLDETEHRHPSLAPPSRRRVDRADIWRDRLQDPKKAQEALVLKEIFSGPWSPRRPRRLHD
ncbi:MAG: hypothetical protein AAF791_08175 [Bacteroidota bacterium]